MFLSHSQKLACKLAGKLARELAFTKILKNNSMIANNMPSLKTTQPRLLIELNFFPCQHNFHYNYIEQKISFLNNFYNTDYIYSINYQSYSLTLPKS